MAPLGVFVQSPEELLVQATAEYFDAQCYHLMEVGMTLDDLMNQMTAMGVNMHDNSGYDWVWPERENHTRESHPYSYSDHFIWRKRHRHALKTARAEYSDRMQQWDYDKWKSASSKGPNKHFRYWDRSEISAFLTEYFGKPIQAVALSEGCNVSSGYPYFVFWFHETTSGDRTEPQGNEASD